MAFGDALLRGVVLAEARVVCVFVHGRGQSPEEMEAAVLGRLSAPGVAYALPRAEGGSWYAARAVAPLTEPTRRELAAALDAVGALVAAVRAAAPGALLLVAGFSQGACVALEYALRSGPWDGALAVLTGCRVGAGGDARPEADLGGMEVYLTGSDVDPWVAVEAFAEAAAALGRARARLRAELFPGRAHEVSDAEAAALDGMLRRLARRAERAA